MPSGRLFCPGLTSGELTLTGDEAHHATGVLRLNPQDRVRLFDGEGREATAVVSRVERGSLQVEVGKVELRPFDLATRVTLATAMPRTHRQGYLIEKCTELGVAAIWPVLAERSVTKPRPGAVDKWKRRAVEAAKQSGRAYLPRIEPPGPLAAWLTQVEAFDAVLLTQAGADATPLTEYLDANRSAKSLLALIGPEGGWTDDEVDQARTAGAVSVSLSPTVLRTETAAVVVCAAVAGRAGVDNAAADATDGSNE